MQRHPHDVPTSARDARRNHRRLRSAAGTLLDSESTRVLGRIFRELGWRDSTTSAVVILMLAAQAMTQTVPPLALRALLDAIPRHDVDVVYPMAGALVGLASLRTLLSLWQRALVARIGYGVLHRLQVKLYNHLERLSLSFFTHTPGGEIQSVLSEDFAVLRAMAVRDTPEAMYTTFVALAGAVVLFLLDSNLAVIAYALAPVIVISSAVIGRKSARTAAEEREASSRLSTLAREAMSIDGVLVTKTLCGQTLGRRFAKQSKTIQQCASRSYVLVRWALMPADLSGVLVTTGTFTYVALRAIDGKPTPSLGTLVVFAAALTSFLTALKNSIERQLDLTGTLGRFGEIFTMLDTKIEIKPGTRPLPAPPLGELRFDRVSFRYAPESPWVLQDLTLRVPAGRCIAIVGTSGAGKTTLGLLAVRLYDPTKGQVTIDGIDIKQLTFDSLHQVGYVPQNPFLFHDTIRANIGLGSRNATDEHVVNAAREAQIHDWIAGLEDGYDTIVGTDGYRLSGGQAQRIIIARTLLNNPPLLVLDEATSALDSATQLEVDRALHRVERNRTTLLIAHRLSTVRRADLIVVLDGGRVIETGTHEQLLNAHGKYAELVRAEHP